MSDHTKIQFIVEAKSGGDEKPKPLSKSPPGIWSPRREITLELRFGHLACTWTLINTEDSPWGLTGTQPCIQVEIAPGIYQVTWMEPTEDTVTMIINLNTKRVSTTIRHSPGPVLELLGVRILEFGPATEMGYAWYPPG